MSKNILIVLTGLLIAALPTYADQPNQNSYSRKKNSYLLAGKLGKFKKVLTGEEEEQKASQAEEEKKETEEEKGKLKEFREKINPPKREYEPIRRRPKKVIIRGPEPWYWPSWRLHRYPRDYDFLRDYYRDLYLRNYISYDEYRALLDRFWYLEIERPLDYRYARKEIPLQKKVAEKKEGEPSSEELRLSLKHQFADDISSDSVSFYYRERKFALDIDYLNYREEVNGTDHLQQIDITVLYQLYSKEAEVSAGAGIKGFYGNGNQWGIQLGIETRLPLTERLSFSLDPRIAFVSDEIVTDLDTKIGYKITDNISTVLGYKSLSLPAEDLSIEGLYAGIELIFK